MLYDSLDALLSVVLTLSVFVIGVFIAIRIGRRKSDPLIQNITNYFLLALYFFWFCLYAISTRVELDAMKIVFNEKDLPGLSVSYGVLALLFSICFSALIISYQNLFFSFPIFLLLGFSDLFGNLSLISGMQFIAHKRAESGGVLSPAEVIWFEYYLGNNHLLRIAIYMMIAYLGFVLSLPSKLRYLDDTYIEESFSGNKNIAYIKSKWLFFEVVSKLVVASAIIINETTMAYWRFNREIALYALKDGEFSSYFGWSIMDAFR